MCIDPIFKSSLNALLAQSNAIQVINWLRRFRVRFNIKSANQTALAQDNRARRATDASITPALLTHSASAKRPLSKLQSSRANSGRLSQASSPTDLDEGERSCWVRNLRHPRRIAGYRADTDKGIQHRLQAGLETIFRDQRALFCALFDNYRPTI